MGLREYDFRPHLDKIRQLYIDEDKTLEEVITLLRRQGFCPSKPTWEKQLRKHKIWKNGRKGTRPSKESGTSHSPMPKDTSDICEDALQIGPSSSLGLWDQFLLTVQASEPFLSEVAARMSLGDIPAGHSDKLHELDFILPHGFPREGGHLPVMIELYLLSNNHYDPPIAATASKAHAGLLNIQDEYNMNLLNLMGIRDKRVITLLDVMVSLDPSQLKVLLSSADPITETIRDVFFSAALRQHRPDILRIIAPTGVDVDAPIAVSLFLKQAPLLIATGIADETIAFDTTELLLSLGARVNQLSSGFTADSNPLASAVAHGHSRLVKLLLEKKAIPHPQVFLQAIEKSIGDKGRNSSEIVEILESEGADVNGCLSTTDPFPATVTLLGFAVMMNKGTTWSVKGIELVERLLRMGADPSAPQKATCVWLISRNCADRACAEPATTNALGLAVALGHSNLCRLLASTSASFDLPAFTLTYRPPLLIAIAHGKLEMALEILAKMDDASIQAVDDYSRIICCRFEGLEDVLVSQGYSLSFFWGQEASQAAELQSRLCQARERRPHLIPESQVTTLRKAIEDGNMEDVCSLVALGSASIGPVSRLGSEAVATLLDQWSLLGPVIKESGHGILENAIETRTYGVISQILRFRDDICQTDGRFLDLAVSGGDVQLIEILIKHQARFTPETFTLIVKSSSPENVRILLDNLPPGWERAHRVFTTSAAKHGSDVVDNNVNTGAAEAMITAIGLGRLDLFRMILGKLFCQSRRLGMVLAMAILQNHLDLVPLLLRAGASPDGDPVGDPSDERQELSAWDATLRSDDIHLVETMILGGADVSARSSQTLGTPAQVAVESKRSDLLKLLIKYGAELNAPAIDPAPATALQYAAIHGYHPIAIMLIDAGANINAEACGAIHGRTALEGAAEKGRIEMLDLLLSRGAQIQGSNRKHFETAISLAEQQSHRSVAKWLRRQEFRRQKDKP
ncbi:hypothetical protein QBC34DRAFT_443417 [Podospora aff. communis PSN243]|uniref:Clr5 domain-containing protein n=1 Tax=Podospora aff. communis PSN243 TaxID=3040156 RepID=A0AAV9G7I5_9PEZI|nr:hypothetical protein QBC34DRAFT_443417 [Podospora aff. communis PSN243]